MKKQRHKELLPANSTDFPAILDSDGRRIHTVECQTRFLATMNILGSGVHGVPKMTLGNHDKALSSVCLQGIQCSLPTLEDLLEGSRKQKIQRLELTDVELCNEANDDIDRCFTKICPMFNLLISIIPAKIKNPNMHITLTRISKAHWEGTFSATNDEISCVASLPQGEQIDWRLNKIAYLTLKVPYLLRERYEDLTSYEYFGQLWSRNDRLWPHGAYIFYMNDPTAPGYVKGETSPAHGLDYETCAYPPRGDRSKWPSTAHVWKLKEGESTQ